MKITSTWEVVIVLMTIFVSSDSHLGSSTLGDECDWTGSGLSGGKNEGRGVTPVYLRCAQGHVTWAYPRGALRVLLRLASSNREFRGCVKVGPEFGGARIFLEGPRSLALLHSNDDGKPKQLARCFHSRNAQVALYLEADGTSDVLEKKVASFAYDLQGIPKGQSFYDEDEDCRPCYPEEMVQLYCSSDYVARGIITSVFNNEDLNRGEVSTRVSRVYRQLHPHVFSPDQSDAVEAELRHKNHYNYQLISSNNVGNLTDSHSNNNYTVLDLRDASDHSYQYGTVFVPLRCGVKLGVGEFIFMGRVFLGDPILSCSPRLEEWVEVRRRALENDDAPCVLET